MKLKILLPIILIGIISYFTIRFLVMGKASATMKVNIGVENGQLRPCPNKPNCVCSQVAAGDEHYIEPISHNKPQIETSQDLLRILKSFDNAKLIEQSHSYIYAQFTSKIFKFVDDVEFIINDSGDSIDVRSASRVGYSDMGANRKRIEKIRLLMKNR